MRELKKASSIWMRETAGMPEFAWQEGYAAFTIGAPSRDDVKAYIANQEQHHRTRGFKEELMLVTARRWASLAALRAGTPESGPTALVFRTGCTYRQRLEQVFAEFGWPSAARFELGTLDGMIGCVAADMGVTLLPRAVVERHDLNGNIRIHACARDR